MVSFSTLDSAKYSVKYLTESTMEVLFVFKRILAMLLH